MVSISYSYLVSPGIQQHYDRFHETFAFANLGLHSLRDVRWAWGLLFLCHPWFQAFQLHVVSLKIAQNLYLAECLRLCHLQFGQIVLHVRQLFEILRWLARLYLWASHGDLYLSHHQVVVSAKEQWFPYCQEVGLVDEHQYLPHPIVIECLMAYLLAHAYLNSDALLSPWSQTSSLPSSLENLQSH